MNAPATASAFAAGPYRDLTQAVSKNLAALRKDQPDMMAGFSALAAFDEFSTPAVA